MVKLALRSHFKSHGFMQINVSETGISGHGSFYTINQNKRYFSKSWERQGGKKILTN